MRSRKAKKLTFLYILCTLVPEVIGILITGQSCFLKADKLILVLIKGRIIMFSLTNETLL